MSVAPLCQFPISDHSGLFVFIEAFDPVPGRARYVPAIITFIRVRSDAGGGRLGPAHSPATGQLRDDAERVRAAARRRSGHVGPLGTRGREPWGKFLDLVKRFLKDTMRRRRKHRGRDKRLLRSAFTRKQTHLKHPAEAISENSCNTPDPRVDYTSK